MTNAVEANKKVLYLRDSRGRIIGRKLIVLSRKGALVGYRSYGSGAWRVCGLERPWVKIVFDLFCREIVDIIGARYPTDEEEDRYQIYEGDEDLILFGEWYNDGSEPVDLWVRNLEGDGFAPDDACVDNLCRYLARQIEQGRGEDRPAEILRAVLWLGDAAGPVLAGLGMTRNELMHLVRHTQGRRARAGAKKMLGRFSGVST